MVSGHSSKVVPVSNVAWGCSWDLQEEEKPCSALPPSQQLMAAPMHCSALCPGLVDETPLLWEIGLGCAVLALPIGKQSAGTATAEAPPCKYQMLFACGAVSEASFGLSEQFLLWRCCCGETFGLFPFLSLPVPLPDEALLSLWMAHFSWVSFTLGK